MRMWMHASLVLAIAVSFGFVRENASPAVTRVAGVALTVADLDRSIEFYTRVLNFDLVDRSERVGATVERSEGVFGARIAVATLALGSERIELREFVSQPGRPVPADSRGNDAWFQHIAIVVSDMRVAFERLRESGVTFASSAPQLLPDWNPNAGGIEAFYFRDPDHHWLELIHFPAGKGDPRWQEPVNEIFLGIDHTAIVVDDTERALEFWRDQLGLEVRGESENHGIEQEHLNGVFGARLRITGLRASHGIGVELLDYLAPANGRAIEPDVAANDVQHWWTLLESADLRAVERITRARRPSWVSPGTIESTDGSARVLSLRDPDRHGVMIHESTIGGDRR